VNHAESRILIALYEWYGLKYRQHQKCWLRIECGGKRAKREAWFLKREGQQAGTGDLLLATPRRPFYGLWLEQKTVDGPLKPHQREFLLLMSEQGYGVAVGYGLDASIKIIDKYMNGQHDQALMLDYLNKKKKKRPYL